MTFEAILQNADSRFLASGSHAAGAQRMGSAEGTEMLPMSCNGQQADAAGLVCSSPPREAWPSILLQPQTQSAPEQAPSPASMQLPLQLGADCGDPLLSPPGLQSQRRGPFLRMHPLAPASYPDLVRTRRPPWRR